MEPAEDVTRAKPTATDLAYDVLKRRVLTCELPPGAPLREGDLATTTALSRTPVREALNRLVQDGLVEVRPRKGYRVTDVTLAGVAEAFELRALLEPAVATSVASLARTIPGRLAALTELAMADPPADLATAIVRDHDVHEMLAGLAGNRYLTRSMRQLLAELQRIMFLTFSGNASDAVLAHHHQDHHRALCEAVLAGDAVAATAAVLAENEHMRRLVVDGLLAQLPDVTLAPVKAPSADPGPRQG